MAASWMGWNNVLSSEINPFCQKVLHHHFPSSTIYGDIRDIDGTKYAGTIDILTGGFPCQPFSAAGRRGGTGDDRFLWPEMLRVIREVQPQWIVGENVLGITSIDDGLVFERVCSEMEESGYDVQPVIIPACAVGAPHRRYRVWFIAHRNGHPIGVAMEREPHKENPNARREDKNPWAEWTCPKCEEPITTDARNGHWSRESWYEAATRLCRVDDGLPRELDGITVPKWRRESLKAYGNAIVPQIAYQIFKSLAA